MRNLGACTESSKEKQEKAFALIVAFLSSIRQLLITSTYAILPEKNPLQYPVLSQLFKIAAEVEYKRLLEIAGLIRILSNGIVCVKEPAWAKLQSVRFHTCYHVKGEAKTYYLSVGSEVQVKANILPHQRIQHSFTTPHHRSHTTLKFEQKKFQKEIRKIIETSTQLFSKIEEEQLEASCKRRHGETPPAAAFTSPTCAIRRKKMTLKSTPTFCSRLNFGTEFSPIRVQEKCKHDSSPMRVQEKYKQNSRPLHVQEECQNSSTSSFDIMDYIGPTNQSFESRSEDECPLNAESCLGGPMRNVSLTGMPYDDTRMPFYTLGINAAQQVSSQIKILVKNEELEVVIEGFSDTMRGTFLHGGNDTTSEYALPIESGHVYCSIEDTNGNQPTSENTAEVHFQPFDESRHLTERTIRTVASKLSLLISSTAQRNPITAARALAKVINAKPYESVKEMLQQIMGEEHQNNDTAKERILTSIKKCLNDFSGKLPGTRKKEVQCAVDNILLSICWDLEKEEKLCRAVAKILDVRRELVLKQIEVAKRIKQAEEAPRVPSVKRAIRKDCIVEIAYQYISDWQHDDRYTRIDTNSYKVHTFDHPYVPDEECKHPQRIWSVVGAEANFQLFKDSEYYTALKDRINKDFGLTTFNKCICKCTKDPTSRSCVDPIISGLEHFMVSLKDAFYHKISTTDKQNLQIETEYESLMDVLKKARAADLVSACCCQREEHPKLCPSPDEKAPKLLPHLCTLMKCVNCGINKAFGKVLNHPVLTSNTTDVRVHLWEESIRQGGKKQLELKEKFIPFKNLLILFEAQLKLCIPHFGEIEWSSLMRKIDIATVPENGLVILTDFAATLDLRANEAVNSSVDSHAWLVNFVAVSNRRSVTVDGNNVPLNDCTVYHYFGSTESKGKSNDHAAHNATLNDIIVQEKRNFLERGVTLKYIKIWTDNCPNQYKCRQNFGYLATMEKRHEGLDISHRFAIKDNFKGVHDAAGKVVKYHLRTLEQNGTRSPNAFQCFINTKNSLEKDDREKWARWEEQNDSRILKKNTFTVCRRIIGWAEENEDEFKRLEPTYQNIVLLKRNTAETPCLSTSLPETKKQHEVSTCQRIAPPSKKFLKVAQAPCSCSDCRDFLPSSSDRWGYCSYLQRRQSKVVLVEVTTTDKSK